MGDVDRTEDGRYIIVAGRRWRATDPAIPDRLRQELVRELMAARRAVKSAADDDDDALARARSRVGHAKTALGERGEPWWDEPTTEGRTERIRAAGLALLTKRGPDSSICPSDIARIVASPDWRPAMDLVRAVVDRMAEDGELVVTQGTRRLESTAEAKGPVRLRLPEAT